MPHDDKLDITLIIGGRKLSLHINRDDEFFYREAARKLNERLVFYGKRFEKVDYQMILTIVALEAGVLGERSAEKARNEAKHNDIDALSDDIDRVLEQL